jgi:hypothetical protein
VNSDLELMWKGAIVAQFEVLYRHLPGVTFVSVTFLFDGVYPSNFLSDSYLLNVYCLVLPVPFQ